MGARLALAWVLASTGEPDAEAVVRALADALAAVHGPDHRDTLAARHLLVGVLRDQHRFEEAVGLAWDLLAVREAVRGPEHPYTLLLRAELALLLHRTGRTGEATALAGQALATATNVQGPHTRYTIRIRDIHHEITVT
ncbi:tetratricopeptide repeat protein [Streptomyces sp. NPDC048484]|uniref:tetratricopeptide repeat protein n=1 Tax=Streptomyces sp. NPDC048484 TaxID=3155146 RepID=UPI0034450FCA